MPRTEQNATQKLREVRKFTRQPYAWPGGYPLFLLMSDGGALCKKCVRKEYRNISDSTRHDIRDGWNAHAVTINWEEPTMFCDHCGERIESAYGDGNGDNYQEITGQ
jgi:hypothetical protein